MAEARNSLASTIDNQFLLCVICSQPFNDPRLLPCYHSFCYKCLEQWCESCSNDNSIVNCPLCKRTYPIPADGIDRFPVNFLLASLQDTVDKAKQNLSTISFCDKHEEQETKYFCQNCSCAACSDCSVLDSTHKGHEFIRLKDASHQRITSLESFIKRNRQIEKRYNKAIQETQQLNHDLDRAADARILAIDEAKNEHIQQVNNLVTAYKQNVYTKKEENVRAIEQIVEKLNCDLARVKNSNDLAKSVIESGSDSDIISLYPPLLSSVQQLAELNPTPVDKELTQFKLEPLQPTSTDLGSLEQLLCSKLHINVDAKQDNISHQTRSMKLLEASQHAQLDAATNLPSRSRNSLPSSSGPKFSAVQKAKSLPRTQPISSKKWKECGKFTTTRSPVGIAGHHNGDIVVTSASKPVAVFTRIGNFKYFLNDSPIDINDVAINTNNNQFIIPGAYGKNEFHIVYDSQGFLTYATSTYDINNQPSRPRSVAEDSTGRIIVGLGYNKHKTVSIHQCDGTLISQFETTSPPCFISCTHDYKLIISFDDNTLKEIDQSGHIVSIIHPPPGVQAWVPMHVCCSKLGELFVSNHGSPKAVYRYVCKYGDYMFVDCVAQMNNYPHGIALSADERELYVVIKASNRVKIFR